MVQMELNRSHALPPEGAEEEPDSEEADEKGIPLSSVCFQYPTAYYQGQDQQCVREKQVRSGDLHFK